MHHDEEWKDWREEEEEEEDKTEDSDDDFSFDDDSFDFDGDETTSEEKKETATPVAEKPAPAEEAIPSPEVETAPISGKIPSEVVPLEKISADQIGLSVSIELGRVTVPLSTLLKLQKGNLLELGIHPEAGVDIVVQGKCVGKGELLKMGDTLGVRILDI